MKKQNIISHFFKITFALFFVLFSIAIYADDDTGFDDGDGEGDNVDDEGPINAYVIPMLAAGIATAYIVLRKKQATV